MNLRSILLIVLIGSFVSVSGQQLLTPSRSFSHNKPAYLTLEDGSELECTIDKIKRKKVLIEEVRIIDENGKKQKLKPEDIKFMYLPPSNFDKLAKANSFIGDATKWNDEKLEQDLLNQGYAYFEYTPVKIKRKTMGLMMQLINPDFSQEIQVYDDPLAKKTTSVGVAGVKVAGGNAKSYYVKHSDDEIAIRIKKKDYDEHFDTLYGNCDSLKSVDPDWSELVNHIIKYTECAE
ncbi:hypothetical protein [Marinilabilia sp.]|uniref:hypothetical protein n=1 Tax=Marinilabilia sp. TaxID=2021252 RepID=UPI0025B99137|nr:hypothetical protein [Marinilabilia sp.]